MRTKLQAHSLMAGGKLQALIGMSYVGVSVPGSGCFQQSHLMGYKCHGISASLQKWCMISRSHGNVTKSHGI